MTMVSIQLGLPLWEQSHAFDGCGCVVACACVRACRIRDSGAALGLGRNIVKHVWVQFRVLRAEWGGCGCGLVLK